MTNSSRLEKLRVFSEDPGAPWVPGCMSLTPVQNFDTCGEPLSHHGSPTYLMVAGESGSPILAVLRNTIFLEFSVNATAFLALRSWRKGEFNSIFLFRLAISCQGAQTLPSGVETLGFPFDFLQLEENLFLISCLNPTHYVFLFHG